jgi:hypothetical protein
MTSKTRQWYVRSSSRPRTLGIRSADPAASPSPGARFRETWLAGESKVGSVRVHEQDNHAIMLDLLPDLIDEATNEDGLIELVRVRYRHLKRVQSARALNRCGI